MNYTNLEQVHPEVRAFIYQQLADIEQLIPDGSAISIYIDDKNKKQIQTQIKIETPFGEINAHEASTDIYKSLLHAKENLLKQLGEIHRASGEDDPEFDEVMKALSNKTYLH